MFIKLTVVTGEDIFIKSDNIFSIEEESKKEGTCIMSINSNYINVKETPEEIIKLIEEKSNQQFGGVMPHEEYNAMLQRKKLK